MATEPVSRKGPGNRTPPTGRLTVTHQGFRGERRPDLRFHLRLFPALFAAFRSSRGLAAAWPTPC